MSVETATETAENKTEAESSSQQSTATETGKTLITEVEGEQKQASSEQKQDTSTETKTAETKTEEKTETKTETKAEGAPEKYEFKDADKMDSKVLEAFSESAKEANLTQEAAQKLLDKVAPALQARTQEQVKQVHQQWTEASTNDKEFGGEKLKENLGVARKALDQLGTPELRTFLDASGLGSHPEVIRLLWKAGKAISEDKFVSGSAVTTEPDIAKRMFPNQA
jgi:hypothetical protein